MSIRDSSVRPRSRTTSTRPRSNYMLLSSLDRRTSLGPEEFARMLAAPQGDRMPGASDFPEEDHSCISKQMEQRRRAALELYESEKAYVKGLSVVDSVYYAPLLRSIGQDAIVIRSTLNRMFSNFVDILQLSRELLLRLEERIGDPLAAVPSHLSASCLPEEYSDSAHVADWNPYQDTLGDLLVPIAPFLKMYTLFMQNFSSAMQCITEERSSNERFAAFLQHAETEAASYGAGAELGLQAQLLTIVQRVPRYRLLLQQLLNNTPASHVDYVALRQTYQVVDATASSINEHVRQQELTLVALSLQRMLVKLDEPLVAPGRRLLRYGTLLKTRRKDIQPRYVYLFSDCLLLASAGNGGGDTASSVHDTFESERLASSWIHEHALSLLAGGSTLYLTHKLPLADCTVVAYDESTNPVSGLPQSVSMPDLSSSSSSSSSSVSGVALPFRHRFDIHSPQCSFSLYAPSSESKQAWTTAIREAHAEHLAAMRSLRKTDNHDFRRTSSSSSNSSSSFSHHSSEFDTGTLLASPTSSSLLRNSFPSSAQATVSALLSPRKADELLPILESYQAPVWVPDSLATRCARCVEPFTIWRRRHHCRLCGQVFCGSCCSAYVQVPTQVRHTADVRARTCLACYAYACESHQAHTPAQGPMTPRSKAPERAAHAVSSTPKASSYALRLVLDDKLLPPLPDKAQDTKDTLCKPLGSVRREDTPRQRRRHARRWSVVSVPLHGREQGLESSHVHTATSGTLTLDLRESFSSKSEPSPRITPTKPNLDPTPTKQSETQSNSIVLPEASESHMKPNANIRFHSHSRSSSYSVHSSPEPLTTFSLNEATSSQPGSEPKRRTSSRASLALARIPSITRHLSTPPPTPSPSRSHAIQWLQSMLRSPPPPPRPSLSRSP
ncbi:hypothetical protein MPSI1_002292 [Malassezia psittaci]|uniref:Uncharacterized protein n=1 Tax=Malassezia psittaci TaxID=1821823 RepID=A0AAF0FAZ6_9BASI|nr:hypothetical protein MPSI1_002292 [Malassezia psittaci]